MATSHSQILKQIAALQAQADALKRTEVAAAVSKARAAILTYGLTQQDLFGPGSGTSSKATKATKSARAAKGTKSKKALSADAKFIDGRGGAWVGRGKRPQWLSSALAAGAKLEDFLASKFAQATAAVTPETPAAAPAAAAAPAPEAAPVVEAAPVAEAAPAPVAKPVKKRAVAKKAAAEKAPAKAE
jgi:DNA-binding protein H-NS